MFEGCDFFFCLVDCIEKYIFGDIFLFTMELIFIILYDLKVLIKRLNVERIDGFFVF